MAIRTDHLIIYHIPKTGGTWVRVALTNAGVPFKVPRDVTAPHPFNLKSAHATPDMVTPKAKDGLLGITFVRRPLGWYSSYWAFRSRKGARRDEQFPADGLWSDTFDTFVNNILDAYPGGFVTQLYQYYTGVHCEKVDFVGRQESLAADLLEALRLAGEDVDEAALKATPRTNQSPAQWQRQCVLTTETLIRLVDCERWVLDTFYG